MNSLKRISAPNPQRYLHVSHPPTRAFCSRTHSLPPLRATARRYIPAPSRHFSSSSSRHAPVQYRRFEVFNEDNPNEPGSSPPNVPKFDWRAQAGAVIIIGGFVYYLVHLERVPETGRWRFMDISPKYEAKLAEAAHSELLDEYKGKILPAYHPTTLRVHRIVKNIVETSNLGTLKGPDAPAFIQRASSVFSSGDIWDPDQDVTKVDKEAVTNPREWNLLVVNDDRIVNAAATYGNVIVFTGILKVANDDDMLAAVLGHEIGHVVARHASERYSSVKVLLALAFILEAAGVDFGLARLGTSLLLELPNSRKQELEADMIGLRLSSKACYDPEAAAKMQTRLANATRGPGHINVDFLQTHPAFGKRIKLLNDMLPEAQAIRAANPSCSQTIDDYSAFRELLGSRSPRQGNIPSEEVVWR